MSYGSANTTSGPTLGVPAPTVMLFGLTLALRSAQVGPFGLINMEHPIYRHPCGSTTGVSAIFLFAKERLSGHLTRGTPPVTSKID
jgi:hypothetical protein